MRPPYLLLLSTVRQEDELGWEDHGYRGPSDRLHIPDQSPMDQVERAQTNKLRSRTRDKCKP